MRRDLWPTSVFRPGIGLKLCVDPSAVGTAFVSTISFGLRSGSQAETLGRFAVRTTTRVAIDIRRMKRSPTHPGEMLLEEFLKPMRLTQAEAARTMRISRNRLNELIRRKRGVTADTALRLARLLGTSPEFWLNLQTSWDLWHAYRAERRRGAA